MSPDTYQSKANSLFDGPLQPNSKNRNPTRRSLADLLEDRDVDMTVE